MNNDNFVGDGFIEKNPYLLVSHRCFRESYSLPNSLNRDFLGCISKTNNSFPKLKIRLHIDDKLIGIRKSLENYEQLDYWWGPKYKEDPRKIAKGVCIHGATKYDLAFGRLKQTEFWWYGKECLTFEIEEVLNEPIWLEMKGIKKIGMRFVHSIFDPETNRPCHLDGAIRLYDRILFVRRQNETIDKFGKNADRLKLWRIDGDIPIDVWFNLIHSFFRNNFMVGEYFGVSPEK